MEHRKSPKVNVVRERKCKKTSIHFVVLFLKVCQVLPAIVVPGVSNSSGGIFQKEKETMASLSNLIFMPLRDISIKDLDIKATSDG